MSKVYDEENIKQIAAALCTYKNKSKNIKTWKKDLKEEFKNGTNKDEKLTQLKNYFDFGNVIKSVKNDDNETKVIKYLNKYIA
ncbi:hypothetical protein [Aliarcobacter butzleri]|uniref:hypothetical protein n=1 Tax=Aliarcobacter butzleri TaxID=28197 RepID=UPI001269A658|nr:hypothetical protein [Aliarcobacter butzleri]